jgi:hypothetical protein
MKIFNQRDQILIMPKISFVLLSVVLFSQSFSLHAAPPTAPSSSQALSQTMTQIGELMVELYPLVVARRELANSEKQQIRQDLGRLVQLFHLAQPHIKRRSDTYQVSYEFVLDYLNTTTRALDAGNFDFARGRLYGLGSICASCHTQDTKLRTLFSGTTRNNFPDDFSFAEFNYVTRNYDTAIRYYDKHLRSQQAKTELEIVQPLQRLITIYTQIYNKPGEGARKLEQYLDLENHTPLTKKHLTEWIAGLKELDARGASKVKSVDFKTLQKYVGQYLGPLDEPPAEIFLTPKEEISRVWLRGLLYHYLNGQPAENEIPKILYWLSICDRSIGYDFYFSLADLYLKECILKHSDHPYARRCLDEYQEYITFSYSGSSGTFIPPEVQQELEKLRKAVK